MKFRGDFFWWAVFLAAIIPAIILVFLIGIIKTESFLDFLDKTGGIIGAFATLAVVYFTITHQKKLSIEERFEDKKEALIKEILENRRLLIKLSSELEENAYLNINYFSSDMDSYIRSINMIDYHITDWFYINPELHAQYLRISDLAHKIICMENEATCQNYLQTLYLYQDIDQWINSNMIKHYQKCLEIFNDYRDHTSAIELCYFDDQEKRIGEIKNQFKNDLAIYKKEPYTYLSDYIIKDLIPKLLIETKNNTHFR